MSGLLQTVELMASPSGARVPSSKSCSCQKPGERISIKDEPYVFAVTVWDTLVVGGGDRAGP